MKDYARMTSEQKAAYNDGLLDALDVLMDARANAARATYANHNAGPLLVHAYALATTEIAFFRERQLKAEPQ